MKHTPITTNDPEDICKERPKKIKYDAPETNDKHRVPFIISNLPQPGTQARDDVLGGVNE